MGRFMALGQVGIEMAACVGVGVAIDYYAGCSPWATVGGAVLGFVGGLAHLVSMASKLGKELDREAGKQPPERQMDE